MADKAFEDYYALLGVSPDADQEILRQSYRDSARKYHPDVNKSPGADILFKQINAAYGILSDEHQRQDYDRRYKVNSSRQRGLELEVLYSRSTLKKVDEPQMLYVLLKIKPLLEMNRKANAPLNICLLIDRSKSMHGARLHSVKNAAHQIVESCNPEDVISVVAFSDFAELIVEPQFGSEKAAIKSRISTIRADGSTEILEGLKLAMRQVDQHRSSRHVNHLILITDGRTYGDEEEAFNVARRARDDGVGISGMGIGEDWNDRFLDELTSITGGSSAYVNTDSSVLNFLDGRVRSLATAYAERAKLVVAPTTGVNLDSVTRISPTPMQLPTDNQPITMGTIDGLDLTSIIMQFHVNAGNFEEKEFSVGRVVVSADILGADQRSEQVTHDLNVTLGDKDVDEEPPSELLDALQSLMLYRLQERAQVAIDEGNFNEATRHLEHLATRLFENGEVDLGRSALQEAQHVTQTHVLSQEGAKRLKYGTRALMLPSQVAESKTE